jgi:hypothetical protein
MRDIWSTYGTCGTITLLDLVGGKSMSNLVKEKISMLVKLKMSWNISLFVFLLDNK